MNREPGRRIDRRRRGAVLGLALGALGALLAASGAAGAPAALAQVPRTIVLQAPARGTVVASPVEVRGRVTVAPFENTLRGRVYDAAGRVVGQGPVMVEPDVFGSLGGPGSFVARLPFAVATGGVGRVEVADLSAANGAVLASAAIDVLLAGPGGPPVAGALPRTGATEPPARGLVAGLAGVAVLFGGFAWRRAYRRRVPLDRYVESRVASVPAAKRPA